MWTALAVWIIASVPFSLAVGKFIQAGRDGRD